MTLMLSLSKHEGRAHQCTLRSAPVQNLARMAFLSILLAAVFGISGQNCTVFGAFTPPRRFLQ